MTDWPAEDIFGNTKKLKFILDAIAAHRQKMGRALTILDFGCGNATGVGQFVVPGAGRYVGVDMHDASLAYARQNYGAPNAEFVNSVPTDVTFDVIIYSDLLEHVHDPLGVIRGHLPQLAQDGIMIGSVPNGYGPCEIEKYVDYYLGIYKILRAVKRSALYLAGKPRNEPPPVPYNLESGHVIWFTMRSLRRMVAAAGLKIAEFRHAGFVGANVTGSVITGRRFVEWNVRVADRLPSWAVSAWHFVMVRDELASTRADSGRSQPEASVDARDLAAV
jgi:SAM-dependent methyltransferase